MGADELVADGAGRERQVVELAGLKAERAVGAQLAGEARAELGLDWTDFGGRHELRGGGRCLRLVLLLLLGAATGGARRLGHLLSLLAV